jgi:hypothetical protein
MLSSLRRATGAALGAGLVLVFVAGAAQAGEGESSQLIDHQKCYKIKDSDTKLRAVVDLYTPQFGFDDGCQLKGKAVMFCVPSHKEVTGASTTEVVGDARLEAWDSLCYKVKCDKDGQPADQVVADQFGERLVAKLRPELVCGPAVKGCQDSSRTVFAGAGRGAGGQGPCHQFEDQASCEEAWAGTTHGNPVSCFWDVDECEGCGPGNEFEEENCTNTCASCANSSLSRVQSCRDLSTQNSCNASWQLASNGLVVSCFWTSSNNCRGCGAANELGEALAPLGGGTCSNTCRP